MPAVAEAAEELSREAEDLLKGVFVARRVVSISACHFAQQHCRRKDEKE